MGYRHTVGVAWLFGALVLGGIGGCDAEDGDSDLGGAGPAGDGNTSTETGPTTGDGNGHDGSDDTTGDGDTGSDPTDDGGSTGTGGGFINEPDGGIVGDCDPMVQDCPDGQKCTAWSSTEGDPWNANRCVEIRGEGRLGDPCNIEGGKYTGQDDCAKGYICLLTDNEGNDGVCTGFCDANMGCEDPNAECVVYNEGSLPICLANCDPLLQDCPDGQGCYGSPTTGAFICFRFSGEAGEGSVGDECGYVNACQPGTACMNGETVDGCTTSSCCSAFCDLYATDPDAPCNGAETCTPWFEEQSAPPGYEHVGVCAIPM